MVQQYGDEKKSCKALQMDMQFVQTEIQRLVPKTSKAAKNTALGVAGFFFIIPLFFMDFTESEQIEVDALRKRYNHLALIAADNDCGYDTKSIPAFDKKPKPKVDEDEGDSDLGV